MNCVFGIGRTNILHKASPLVICLKHLQSKYKNDLSCLQCDVPYITSYLFSCFHTSMELLISLWLLLPLLSLDEMDIESILVVYALYVCSNDRWEYFVSYELLKELLLKLKLSCERPHPLLWSSVKDTRDNETYTKQDALDTLSHCLFSTPYKITYQLPST